MQRESSLSGDVRGIGFAVDTSGDVRLDHRVLREPVADIIGEVFGDMASYSSSVRAFVQADASVRQLLRALL